LDLCFDGVRHHVALIPTFASEINPDNNDPMRMTLAIGVTMLIWAVTEAATAPVVIYDRDPRHVWNRLYREIAVRTDGATAYGIDQAEPFHETFDHPQRLIAVLKEFLAVHGETRCSTALRLALFQNDLWSAFDLAASPPSGPTGATIRPLLARVIQRLALPQSAIARLPDNYAAAVKSVKFAADFDPSQPGQPFLPPDLFDANGPWVQIAADDRGAPVAPMHVEMLSGRSLFKVFIRVPGGRAATLAYLAALNLYPTPWALKPADIATTYPDHEKVRWSPLRFDPQTPQFPPGTIVALVRQMMVIDDKLEPVPTAVTQKVQFRVYQEVGPATAAPFEFVLRRHDLLGEGAVGLHAVTPGDAEYQLTTIPMGVSRAQLLSGPVVLSTCARCHSAEGIFSVNSYTSPFSPDRANPQLLPARAAEIEAQRTADWKEKQFNWGLLRGLLERGL
jgi:hypothetical protein